MILRRIARTLGPLSLLVILSLAAVTPVRADLVIVERESALRAEPSLGAATVATVGKGVRGESIGKSGIWVHIKTPEATGWVFTFNVRFGERSPSGGGGFFSTGGAVSARPTTSVVSTIGIRGLSEEDLQNAAFNAAEMRRLEGYGASRDASAQRARQAGLAPVSVEYLEAP